MPDIAVIIISHILHSSRVFVISAIHFLSRKVVPRRTEVIITTLDVISAVFTGFGVCRLHLSVGSEKS